MQVRRGADRADIYSLAFSSNAQWLAVSSDKGTIHIFGLNVPRMGEDLRMADGMPALSGTNGSGGQLIVSSTGGNISSSLSFMKGNDWSWIIQSYIRVLQFIKMRESTVLTSWYLTGVLPKYFSSQWSFAQFHLPEGLQFLVAFGHQKNTIVIAGLDGR